VPNFEGYKLRRSRALLACGVMAAALLPALAHSQVPPQATPGGQQPLPPAAPNSVPPATPMLSVPPMLDRPLGLEEGPRVIVKSFKLIDAKEHANLGLTVEMLNKQLGAQLKTQPATGFTVNQLQQIAAQLSDTYHKHGLLLAQVVVPAQEIRDGTVQLRVLEGILEAVKVENNKHTRASALIAPFSPLIGSAFEQSATDAALLRLTDYPGVTVFGVVTPGTAVGTSDLVLRVQHEQVIEATIGLDNFGTKLAGEDRGSINLRWNSPLGLGDRFSIYGLHTQTNGDSAAHTNYGGADYRIPVFAARGSVAVDYSLNAYDVGESLGVTGRVKVGSISYHQDFFRTRRADFYGDISFADKRADVTTPVGLPGQEHVRDYSGQIGWRYSDSLRGFNDLSLSYLHGSQSTPNNGDTQVRLGSAGSYNVIGFHLQRQQGLTRYQSLIATVGGQTSSEALPTLEQIALGGPGNARGYGVADYVGDKGYYGTLEYVIGAPGFAHVAGPHGKTWGELLQFSLFGDYARGITNSVPASIGVNVPTVDMRDWGAALQFNLPDRFYARVSWARQISPDPFVRLTDSKTSHVYGSLGFTF